MTPAGPAGPGFDADVIVIGCGPVGVMAALRCAQRGLSVIAIDRSDEIYPLPRALGMDDETQLLFERAGLGDELRRNSAPLLGAEFVDRTGERVVGVELPPGTVGSLGHPPAVTFDQPGLERALRAAAAAAGVEFRLGFEAFAIGDLDPGVSTGVVVSVGDQSVDAELTARWAIAADGAKSTVRSLRGIAMVDQGFDQTWLVIDTTLQDPDLPLPPAAQQLCDPARVSTFVPGPANHRRWEFQLLAGETRDEMLDEAVIWKLLAPWATPGQLSIDRTAVYRFHATVAERFRDGPVFLAGDAAHQMPPFNGQGMCAGLRDAENLSWKLAMVANGRAGDTLLDSYDTERRPHAAAQVGHSVDAGMLMQAIAHDGEAALESGYGQRSFPKLAGDLFQPGHPRVGSVFPAPTPGPAPAPAPASTNEAPADSLPGDGWLVVGADRRPAVDGSLAELGATAVAASAGAYPGLVDGETVAIVRPDRYLAAVTTDPEGAAAEIVRLL